jgi:hypothetical protein
MTYTLTRNYDGDGSGFLSPDGKIFYVNIAKNASSYMADILPRQGWQAARCGHDQCGYGAVERVLVILRCPEYRWISGVSQYLKTKILRSTGPNTYEDDEHDQHDLESGNYLERYPMDAAAFIVAYSALIERFIFDNLDMLDDHVWPQHGFFSHILPFVPRRYMFVNIDGYVLDEQLLSMGIQTYEDADHNRSRDDPDLDVLTDFFRKRLISRPFLRRRLHRTYAADYTLIAHAKSLKDPYVAPLPGSEN